MVHVVDALDLRVASDRAETTMPIAPPSSSMRYRPGFFSVLRSSLKYCENGLPQFGNAAGSNWPLRAIRPEATSLIRKPSLIGESAKAIAILVS